MISVIQVIFPYSTSPLTPKFNPSLASLQCSHPPGLCASRAPSPLTDTQAQTGCRRQSACHWHLMMHKLAALSLPSCAMFPDLGAFLDGAHGGLTDYSYEFDDDYMAGLAPPGAVLGQSTESHWHLSPNVTVTVHFTVKPNRPLAPTPNRRSVLGVGACGSR